MFLEKKLSLNICDWQASNDPSILRGLVALSPILQEAENLDESSLTLSHSFVAELSDIEAKSLELPLTVPYQLRIWDEGNWVDDTYELHSEFLDRGQPVFIDERVGCLVKVGRYSYHVPSPLYDLMNK